MEIFKTELKTIKLLLETEKIKFIIPTYQRPYVWENVQVLNFLEEIQNSFKNKTETYFIGNVYVMQSFVENTFDIIDGQQRFTTVWLIALVYKQLNIDTELIKFLGSSDNLLLNFTIRKDVEHYLKNLLDEERNVFKDSEIESNEFLKNIAKAIETIKYFINQLYNKEDFANYLFENVQFVFNTAPKNTDLNSLFTALGNSGIQLEQTDILKSKLLKNIDNKVLYSKIWEACENMNDYFENNVVNIFSTTDKNTIDVDSFSKFECHIFNYNKSEINREIFGNKNTISQILASDISILGEYKSTTEQKTRCRSIVSFSVLMLHTYRIFRNNDFTNPFDKKYLLEIFKDLTETSKPTEIISFFELLWKVRFVFDKYVVKWRYDNDSDENSDDEEKLRLTSSYKIENSFTRQNLSNSNLSMLQSVLYFTGGFNQQYWLTPYLSKLIDQNFDNSEATLSILEIIENSLSITTKTQKEESFELKLNVEKMPLNTDYFNESKGTSFNRYWFYKLEYVLWKNWKHENDDKFKKYRITSKNSVEHVYPQNPENEIPKLDDSISNSFGNLALLSVGQNSSYSNQDVGKKKIDFKGKSPYQSLKLAKIYVHEKWSENEIQAHQAEMITLLEEHYK